MILIGPAGVSCPYCMARRGDQCRSKGGKSVGFTHVARRKKAARATREAQDVEQLAKALAGYGPVYQHGHLSIENAAIIAAIDQQSCEVGVQVSQDGRIWLCVNGTSFIRFKPVRT
jgi:hypothetical protein